MKDQLKQKLTAIVGSPSFSLPEKMKKIEDYLSEDTCSKCAGNLYWKSASTAVCDNCGHRIP